MFSQGAMALGGVIYGTTAHIFGVAAVLVVVADVFRLRRDLRMDDTQ
jgi:hypothetical protein